MTNVTVQLSDREIEALNYRNARKHAEFAAIAGT